MTKAQQVYTLQKIKSIIEAKVAETKKAEGWPRITLYNEAKHALIVSGEVKLKKLKDITLGYHQGNYFDFSKHEQEAGISAKGQKRLDQLGAIQVQAEDEIMLGDSQEALALLETLKDF
tara:strand:- start:1356 stop:1712 length:357 start_codon:yes stop_codon:yes gene_type:complete